MDKKILETFIKKYNLNGNIEAVKWVVGKDKTLKTNAISEDKTLLVSVALQNFDGFSECDLGVYDTAKLKQLLGVLNDDISVKLNEVFETDDKGNNIRKITSVVISSDKTEMTFAAADLSVVPSSPAMKNIPPFNCEVVMDGDFVSRFSKSTGALSEVETFTLLMTGQKKDKIKMVLGHTDNANSNKISLDVTTTPGLDKVDKPIRFNAKFLKAILDANSDCDSSILKVSDKGLASVLFDKNGFTSQYYIVAIQSVD